jgi:DNA-binding CsgD family transcriptional regulator
MTVTRLYGRDGEADALDRLLGGVPGRGGALVVRGEAGIGKSALLSEAAAACRGMLVLTATGVQSEADLPFAGLHQLLRPLLTRHSACPAVESSAIKAAFGAAGGVAPELYLTALATLELLSEAAAHAPILLIAEDAQWLDRPTCDVLAFIGRRLESDPVVLLAAIRDGYDSPLLHAGLPELHLRRLADEPARALLNARFPDLTPAVRDRLLAEAEGNPLALMELPAALGPGTRGGETALPGPLPLTARLERAFAARAAELPAPARALLRIAAADDSGEVAEVRRAAEIAGGARPSMEDLAAAVDARLVEVDGTSVRFRHPLVRSAVYQAASIAERQAAHAALAEVLSDDPDRRAWHRAAAAVGKDPAIAAELEQAAGRACDRGGLTTAAAAFERAADFAGDPAQRGALLLRAAEAASELGRAQMVRRLLPQADSLQLRPRERALSMWLGDGFRDGPAGDPVQVRELAAAARQMRADGDIDLALSLLSAAAARCAWAGLDQDACGDVLQATDEVTAGQAGAMRADSRVLLIQAYAAPVRRGAAVISGLSGVPPADPESLYRLGTAACMMGAFSQSSSLLAASAVRLREQGRLRLLAHLQLIRAWSAIMTADYATAVSAAEEAERLAAETAQPLWQTAARTAQAALAALRGEEAPAEKLAADAERVVLPARAAIQLKLIQDARGTLALGQGRPADAFEQLRLSQPGDPARHHLIHCFAVADFAEAAVRSGHLQEAADAVSRIEPLAAGTRSPWLAAAILYARALLADDEAGYARALGGQDLASWPFHRARLQQAYGEWLRRQRRSAESRVPLRAARDTFDALGLAPWAERARQELRAAGESSQQRKPHALDQLSPQELQIAQMAAKGLSNRAIAQRLYLSHRTVESHLYRVFPKLGITSRAQLTDALTDKPRT